MKRVRDVAGSSESETEGLCLGAPASQLRCPVGRRRAFLVHRRAAVMTVLALAAALGGLYLVWLLMAPLGRAERAG